MDNKSIAGAAILMALSEIACGSGRTVLPGGGDNGVAGAGGGGGTPGEAMDASADIQPAGACTTDDDCVAVLDYRNGFSCWNPSAASKTDVGLDPCLVPWTPDPKCTTPEPPAGCPSGSIPVMHSCPATGCAFPACLAGRCTITFGFGDQCATPDAGAVDCGALRTRFQNLLTAAQQCDPTKDPSPCEGDYSDSCGCETPYDLTKPEARFVACAFNDLHNAGCPNDSCGEICVIPTTGACVPQASGTTGTCAWK